MLQVFTFLKGSFKLQKHKLLLDGANRNFMCNRFTENIFEVSSAAFFKLKLGQILFQVDSLNFFFRY